MLICHKTQTNKHFPKQAIKKYTNIFFYIFTGKQLIFLQNLRLNNNNVHPFLLIENDEVNIVNPYPVEFPKWNFCSCPLSILGKSR